MRQKLILHIGTHKTGSTTIQNYLFFNRLFLRHLGVFYPKPNDGGLLFPNNHRDLRDTAFCEERPRDPQIHDRLGPHDERLARYISKIKSAGCPINILSCEGWSSHLNRYARRLAPLTQHFDVKVIAYMRRPDIWVEKFYSQRIVNVEHRETRDFRAFIDQPCIEMSLYDRARLFSWWAKVFGGTNVTVIPYEPAEQAFDLLGKFLSACGVENDISRNLLLSGRQANPTLSPALTEAVRRRTEIGKPMRHLEIQRLKRVKPEAIGSYQNEAERTEILARAQPDMQKICEKYVRDGRSKLFPFHPEQTTSYASAC